MINETKTEIIESENEEPVQYLTFMLDGEDFATQIARVREVLEYDQITPVPRTPEYMLGVINLRGSVVPVVDMRLQFGIEAIEPTVDTCIIIVEVQINGEPLVLGALVDSVQEVIDLRSEQMEPAPTLGTRVNTEYIQAMGKVDDHFVIVLDMEQVFSMNELLEMKQQGSPEDKVEETLPVANTG